MPSTTACPLPVAAAQVRCQCSICSCRMQGSPAQGPGSCITSQPLGAGRWLGRHLQRRARASTPGGRCCRCCSARCGDAGCKQAQSQADRMCSGGAELRSCCTRAPLCHQRRTHLQPGSPPGQQEVCTSHDGHQAQTSVQGPGAHPVHVWVRCSLPAPARPGPVSSQPFRHMQQLH